MWPNTPKCSPDGRLPGGMPTPGRFFSNGAIVMAKKKLVDKMDQALIAQEMSLLRLRKAVHAELDLLDRMIEQADWLQDQQNSIAKDVHSMIGVLLAILNDQKRAKKP